MHFSMSLKDLRIQWNCIMDELKRHFNDSGANHGHGNGAAVGSSPRSPGNSITMPMLPQKTFGGR